MAEAAILNLKNVIISIAWRYFHQILTIYVSVISVHMDIFRNKLGFMHYSGPTGSGRFPSPAAPD